MRDVAAAAGVSTGTASQALNGSPLIRPETRARVLTAAQRLNYVPDRNASRLLKGHTECVGVGLTGMDPPIGDTTFYAMVLRGITETLEERGYTLRLIRFDAAAPPRAGQSGRRGPLSAQDVDGLVMLNWQDSALMERLHRIGVPLVVVDASSAYPDELSVDNDDQGGVAMGVAYLIGLGHRRIALLNNELAHPFGRAALAGYLDAYTRHGLVVEPWLLQTSPISITAGRLAMATLLAGDRPPTAVFAVADELAVGAMQAISEAGLHVPGDVSVVGMDDIPLAAQTRPSLTTVRVDMVALGRRGTEMLLQAIDGQRPDPSHLVLPTTLVVRDSAGPPPGVSHPAR